MKLKRTPVWDRKTYIYHFCNGDRSVVSIGKVTTYHNGICSIAYDETITADTIAFLHKLDDKEVRDNLKAINFEDYGMRKERLAKKKEWEIKNPNEENPYDKPIKVIHLNSFTPEANLDMIDNFLYQNSLDEENTKINEEKTEELSKQIRDYVATLSPSMQELFDLLYVQGLSQSEAKFRLNISRKAISKRAVRLENKIFERFSSKTATNH